MYFQKFLNIKKTQLFDINSVEKTSLTWLLRVENMFCFQFFYNSDGILFIFETSIFQSKADF